MAFTAPEVIPVLAAWRCWEYRYSFPDGRQVPHRVTTRSMLPVTTYTPVWRDTKQGAEFLFQEKKSHDKLKPQTHRTLAPADLEDG